MEKQTLEKKDKTVKKEKKLPKEVSQEILKKIFRNLLKGIGLMIYFIVLNMAYGAMKQERLIEDIKVFAGAYLLVGIVMLEKAYKNEKTEVAVTGIEFMFIALHSLTIMHVITMFKYDFRNYLLTSSYIFSIYYVLKSIILYTKEKREYLKSFSDISEIVKRGDPVKKEAKKKIEIKENEKEVNSNEEILTKEKKAEKEIKSKWKTTKAKLKDREDKTENIKSKAKKTKKKEGVKEAKKTDKRAKAEYNESNKKIEIKDNSEIKNELGIGEKEDLVGTKKTVVKTEKNEIKKTKRTKNEDIEGEKINKTSNRVNETKENEEAKIEEKKDKKSRKNKNANKEGKNQKTKKEVKVND